MIPFTVENTDVIVDVAETVQTPEDSITPCSSCQGVTLRRLSADGDVSMATQLSGQQQLLFLQQVDKTEGWSRDNTLVTKLL